MDDRHRKPEWYTFGTSEAEPGIVSDDVLQTRARLALTAELLGVDNVPAETQRLAIAELAKLPEWMAHLGLKTVPLPSSRREWEILLVRLGADVNSLLAFKRGELEPWEVIRLAAERPTASVQPVAKAPKGTPGRKPDEQKQRHAEYANELRSQTPQKTWKECATEVNSEFTLVERDRYTFKTIRDLHRLKYGDKSANKMRD